MSNAQKISVSIPQPLALFIEHYQKANKTTASHVVKLALTEFRKNCLAVEYAKNAKDEDWKEFEQTIGDGINETW